MKITWPGKVFHFECKSCGCKFDVGANEKDLKRDYTIIPQNESSVSCHCPMCDEWANEKIEVVELDGGFTREEFQKKGDQTNE